MLSRRTFLIAAAAAPVAGAMAKPALADTPEIYAPKGIALKGYDPVAYFKEATDVKGDPAIATSWKGAEWHFASAENLADFAADPDRFAPQYGGWCAYAVANGYTAKTDADAWTIHNGKLYLNFNKSIRRKWLRDVDGFIARGDANWPNVLMA